MALFTVFFMVCFFLFVVWSAEDTQRYMARKNGGEPEELPTRRMRVILESPFAPSKAEPEGRAREFDFFCKKMYLRLALYDSFARGESPFASHGLYTQALDDTNAVDRLEGIVAGIAWLSAADAVVVYEDLGVSIGMLGGMDRAEGEGLEVERRTLFDDPAARIAFYHDCRTLFDRGEERLGKFFAQNIEARCYYRDTVIRAIEEQHRAILGEIAEPQKGSEAGRHDC